MPATQRHLESQHGLLERLADARTRSDELFELVRPDALYERPIPERHRIVFYRGHLEAFDWNLFRDHLLALKPFHPSFDRLFAFGIDPVGGGLPSDQPAEWPSWPEVSSYVSKVRQTVDDALNTLIGSDSPQNNGAFSANLLLNVAIEHRLMHAETLAYMLHQLPIEMKIPKPRKPVAVVLPIEPRMIEIPPGSATLGLARNQENFGWDNEYEAHAISVPPFEIDLYKVTNRQYLDFMAAGGYENRALWKDADWIWKTARNISHPAFWQKTGEHWSYRTMFENLPLPLAWPVYVSHAEASAYARWVGKSLPSEAQWHRAAYATPEGSERSYPWGSQPPNSKLGNFDFHRWDPSSVGAYPEGRSAFGVADLLGNGWEWTSSLFEPFAGFQPFPFYPGYSADFFDGKHYVMKGGSTRTAACMLRRSFRNWFQPHYQYVYAGFRCVST